MTTYQFILELVDLLFRKFTTIDYCEYEVDDDSNTIFIRIPKGLYNSDEFPLFDIDITDKAFELKLEHGICFITEDSMIELSNSTVVINDQNNEAIMKNLKWLFESKGIGLNEFSIKSELIQVEFNDLDNEPFKSEIITEQLALAA